MALFKIFNNIDSKNTTLPSTYTKGYMYYDAKDSIFYIDIAGDGGETGVRQKINAWGAEKTLKDSLNQQIDTTYVKNIVISNNELSFITGDNTSHSVPGILGAVTGVKGNAESSYRIGNVNITKASIGLGNVENTKLSTWAGTSNITTIGTLSSGTVPWARLSDIPNSSTTTAGIIQIGSGAINAAAGNHTHTTTIATDNGTNQLTLAFGTKYKLTAGGTSYIFTMPPNPNTNTASAVDNILHGSNNGTEITYAPYTSRQSGLSFDTTTTAPTGTDRLNLNGYLYATKLYSGGQEVLTALPTATTSIKGGVVIGNNINVDTNGEISIDSTSVTEALGYTPYNSSNPNGYTDNVGTITGIKMNGSSKGTSGVVDLGTVVTDVSGKLNKSGGTMTGALTLKGDPTSNLHAATKQYVDNILNVANAVVFKGGIASGDNLPAANCGDLYRVTSDGKINGIDVWTGDTLICTIDNTNASTPNNWLYLQTGDGTVIGPNQSTAGNIVVFTGNTGKGISDSGFTIAKSVPEDAEFTDTKVTSVNNHYTPSANLNSELTASLSGTVGSYALNTEYTVLTGVKAQRDAKGHVTGLTYTAQKIKDTNTTYTFDGTYNASTNKVATVSTVTNAINNLDVSNITGFGAGKTLSTLSEANGKISASFQDISIPLSQITGADDIKAIEALTGTSGILKKTANNTWTLDTTAYTTNTGTVTKVSTGAGLIGGDITNAGIIEANLNNSKTSLGTIGITDKLYAVGIDVNGELAVNVPWTDTQVTQTAKTNDDTEYKILTTSSASPTSGAAAKANYSTKFKINPKKEILTAPHFLAEHISGGANEYRVTYGNTVDMALMIGTSNTNHGLYDNKALKWMVYADNSGNVTLNGNAATATKFASAQSITLTGDITGTTSSQAGWSIATTIGQNKVTNDMLAGSITNAKLNNSKITIAGNDVSLGGSITADTLRTSLGLSNAMHFKGTTTTTMSDGLTTAAVTIGGVSYTPSSGDVVLYSDSEFVWTGSAWERLGRDSSFKITQTAITDSTGTSESTTATRFVYSISQDANGVVSVKTRPLPTYNNYSLPLAANGTRGGIQIGYSESGTNYAVKLYSEKAYVTVPWTDRYVNSASFVDDTTNNTNSPIKLTLTRAGSDSETITANIPKVSSTSAGIVPKGNDVSNQSQSTQFLREDGTWATPSYTTNTDENVKQTNTTTNSTYSLLLSNSEASATAETAGVNKSSRLTWNPSTRTLDLVGNGTSGSTNNVYISSSNKGRINISSVSTLYLSSGSTASIVFQRNGVNKITFNTSDELIPATVDNVIQTIKLGNASTPYESIYGKVINVTDTTDSTSTSTGSLIVAGGIGCAKSIYAASVWGAVWNDYAEFRKDNVKEKELQQPGRCVREVGDGTLTLTDGRLQRGCEIISDTFGFAIGQDKENGYNTPIASSGRVLAYLYEDRELARNFIGWPVCSGPNGTVSIMTEEEENRYSNRIVGTISEIPDYEKWGTGKVKVNGRIWIRIK